MPKSKPNPSAVVEARRAEVEQVLLSGDWTLKTQSLLAKRHGIAARTIRHDALVIRQRWTEDAAEVDADTTKSDWLARLRAAQVQARRDRQYATVGRLMHLEAKALGHLEPTKIQIDAIGNDPRDLASMVLDSIPLVNQILGITEPQKTIDVIDIDGGGFDE